MDTYQVELIISKAIQIINLGGLLSGKWRETLTIVIEAKLGTLTNWSLRVKVIEIVAVSILFQCVENII